MLKADAIPVLLNRIDPARNMARYYSVAIEPTLFGWSSVVRDWGRIGRTARRRLDLYDGKDQALAAAGRLLADKLRRGYAPR
ncbi:putative DNA-binding WGR domain protein [Aquamicrobium terrae]